MKVYPGILLLLLLSWTAQETFCKGSSSGDIACGECGNICKNIIKDREHCNEYCKLNNGTLVKVLIGPVLPYIVPVSGMAEFELCQEGKCVQAAEIGLFGGGKAQPPSVISKDGYFIRTTDVTRVLVAQGWSPEKTLTARMTNSTRRYVAENFDVKKLPEPVVLVGEYPEVINDGWGKLTLNPNEDRSHYGNLLDEWSG